MKQEPIVYHRKEEFENYIREKLKGAGFKEEDILYILSKIQYKSYFAGQAVFVLDDICMIMGVLLTGSMITTLPNKEAKLNNTDMIHGTGFPLVCHRPSFNSRQKSAYVTIAFEDSTIAFITYKISEELYKKYPALERYIRLLQDIDSAKRATLYDEQKPMEKTEIYSATMKNYPDMYRLFGADEVDGHLCCNKNTRGRSANPDKKKKNKKTKPPSSSSQTNLEF